MKKTNQILITVAVAVVVSFATNVSPAGATTPGKQATKTSKAKKAKTGNPEKVDLTRLLDPSKLTAKSPEVFTARFDTSKGPIEIEVHRAWSPRGADRFYNLVRNGFYDGARFYRVIPGFMAQFGFNGDPAVNAAWQPASIQDDPVAQSNTRGMVSFAMRGPDTRTTQLFINYANNARLDTMGFSPFGKVTTGMDVADSFYGDYGEGAPSGRGPGQDRISSEGNPYLAQNFPQLDYIKTARVVTK